MGTKAKLVGGDGGGPGEEVSHHHNHHQYHHQFHQTQQTQHHHQQTQQQQALIDQLFKAAELVESGNLVHARGILARLNHQLSPVGKPLHRAAFYFKEALLLLSNNNAATVTAATSPPQRISTPFDVFLKIGSYKAFSETSPIVQFANFTCNQVLLEALEGFNSIRIIDFDLGLGGQWASFMQEISLRMGGAPSLRITAITSPSSHDHPLELVLAKDNLSHFASDLGISFAIEILSLDSYDPTSWSLALNVSEGEAIAVNLPASPSSYHPSTFPSILRLVKQLSPKIVVSVERGSDRTDLSFSQHFLHSLNSNAVLLESLDAVSTNPDTVNKIERFLLQPRIDCAVLRRHCVLEKVPPCRTIFATAAFSPFPFSNFTETQAEWLVKRIKVRGFHVEKRQNSLVLCWQMQDLVSVSAWTS
ncbi:hypothetical protein Scep_006902 [Stephania cephalantha]|uniref:Scarecrow-like protein 6 n=1 Tax=Stephania cephalantha TaxID=152367 RepID=A0AAP0KA23_9MAGN